jgi:hypothetical protein
MFSHASAQLPFCFSSSYYFFGSSIDGFWNTKMCLKLRSATIFLWSCLILSNRSFVLNYRQMNR